MKWPIQIDRVVVVLVMLVAVVSASGQTTAPDVAAGEQSKLNGSVLSPERKPVSGARVSIYPQNLPDFEGQPIQSVKTTADGKFRLEAVIPRQSILIVQADGYPLSSTNLQSETIEPEIQIGLRQGAKLRLPILGSDGQPLPDVQIGIVAIYESESPPMGRIGFIPAELQKQLVTTSNAGGICVLSGIPRGVSLNIKVLNDGFISENTRLDVPDAEAAEVPPLRARRGVIVSGRVVDAETGQGVPGVSVNDTARRDRSNYGTGGKTDATGAFRFSHVPAGEHTLSAVLTPEMSSQYVSEPPLPVTLAAGEEANDLVIKLVSGIAVRGKAIDSKTGKGIVGARIGISQESASGFSPLGSSSTSAITGDDGTFVAKVRPGAYIARISGLARLGYSLPEPNRRDVKVEAAQEPAAVEFSCAVYPGLAVTGRAVDAAGNAVSGASVIASVSSLIAGSFSGPESIIRAGERSGGETTTGADGTFTLPFVTDNAVLSVRKGNLRMSEPIQINARNRELGQIKLLDQPKGSILVKAVDSDGKPLPGATVSVSWSASAESFASETRTALAGEDGTCHFSGLYTDYNYSVNVAAKGFTRAQSRDIKVQANKETVAPTAQLNRADGFVAGVLIDKEGLPIAGADIRASTRDSSNPAAVRTDMSGRFRIDGLVSGSTVSLFPRVDGEGPGVANGGWEVGTSDITLIFDPAAPIVGPVGGRGRGRGRGQ